MEIRFKQQRREFFKNAQLRDLFQIFSWIFWRTGLQTGSRVFPLVLFTLPCSGLFTTFSPALKMRTASFQSLMDSFGSVFEGPVFEGNWGR